MLDGVTGRQFLALSNLLQSPPDDPYGLGVILVLRLAGEPNLLSLGLVKAHVRIVRFVVRTRQETNEERLRVILATDAEGVVRSLAVVHGEDCPTGLEELGVLDVVHCGNSMG